MRITDTSDTWWKNAVFYCLDVETFMDWNDDGIGDFDGLVHRMDYLAELGVTCLWLMPFYPSPQQDDGYDISDFYGVDPRFGSLGDVVEVIRTAKDRGIRVIIDLVVNHTSDKHPWFVSAKASRNSAYRDWYVWRDEIPPDAAASVFPGEETGVWEWEPRTEQYYLHSFYRTQPDLNVANPAVREEIERIMGFWLQLGIAGFRVDAVPFLLDTDGIQPGDGEPMAPLDFLASLRAFLGRRTGDAVLLGEANLPRRDQAKYFGDGDGLSLQFDFITMQSLYLALAREDTRPLAKALRSRSATAVVSQWANFVRNHDELTLDKLSDRERQEVFDAFGPDPEMQVYGRGIIRRLPPMLHGDPRRIRMVYSLMFSLPGSPVLFYGEELGMGDNLDAGGRESVRTPMQWSAGKNGGFSKAAPSRLPAPVVDSSYAPAYVNASEQRHNPDSMLRFMRTLIERYRSSPEIGWGELTVLDQPDRTVFAHCVSGAEGRMIAAHNFGGEATTVSVTIEGLGADDELTDLLVDGPPVAITPDGRVDITLDGYGYRWLRVLDAGGRRLY